MQTEMKWPWVWRSKYDKERDAHRVALEECSKLSEWKESQLSALREMDKWNTQLQALLPAKYWGWHFLEAAVNYIRQLWGHNETLKNTVGILREQINAQKEDLRQHKVVINDLRRIGQEETEKAQNSAVLVCSLTEDLAKSNVINETLKQENESLRKGIPPFKPRNVRWSGPNGVRAQAEAASANQASESQRIQKATEDQREEVSSNGNEV